MAGMLTVVITFVEHLAGSYGVRNPLKLLLVPELLYKIASIFVYDLL